MADFPIATVADCLDRFSGGAATKLTRDRYRTKGAYPIIDQGQVFIAGWTDDAGGLISDGLPLIVFGDHTRAFKYVEFPFVRGADGTQVLKPKAGIDPLYFYYACKAISLPSRGYNRHYKELKESTVALPEFDEQVLIGHCLRVVEEGVDAELVRLDRLEALKRTSMRELFTRGLRGEAQKETEFGAVPESWNIAELDDHAQVQTGAAKGRKLGNADTVEVPYLRVANVQDGHLDLREMKTIKIRKSEVERYRLHVGDVALTEGGDFDKLGRGFIWQGELQLCVHQNHVFAVRPDPQIMTPDFFAYLAQSAYGKAYFLKVAHKTTNLACINTTKLKAFPLLVPSLEEQCEICAVLRAIDAKIDIHRRKKAALEELFRALLHKLTTGEIRAADLDLSALETDRELAA